MTSSTRQIAQVSLLLILTLKISLVLSTRPEVPLNLIPLDESFSSDRFLQEKVSNNNNNQATCPPNRWCRILANDNVQYTVVLSAKSLLTVMAMISSDADTTLTITYASSSSSSQINTELDVTTDGGPNQSSTTLDTPTTNSYTTTVSQDIIQAYAGGTAYFSVDNESDGPTTVTIKMTFGDGSGSSSSTLTHTSSDSGVSLINIILPIAGTLMLIFILGICCHYRRKRQEQERMARVMRGGRGRRVRGARNGEDQQADGEEEDEEIEDPLTEQNINERFPEGKFGNLKSSFPQTTCSVCLEEFQKGVACRQLYCEHMFHSECIRLWLANQLKKGHAFCPNCNKDMMSKPAEAAPSVEVQA